MALYRNKSNGSVTFYDPRQPFQRAIPPGQVVDSARNSAIERHPDFEPVDNFWTYIHEHPGAKVAIVRSYALGDVLMVYALLQALKPVFQKLNVTVGLFTQRRFFHVFKHCTWMAHGSDEQLALVPCVQRKFDIAFSLNDILEQDHALPAIEQRNRMYMLAHALGVEDVVDV